MTLRYILVQLIGLCGTLLFFSSYQCEDNRKLFRVQFVSYLIYTLHLMLLGAVTGRWALYCVDRPLRSLDFLNTVLD